MSKGRDIKPHIAIFGRRNNGKSSMINALVNQEIAIVSDTPGTTTDPVKKSIEIFGIGPAILIDTAGIDDVGELGAKRVGKTLEMLKVIDCAILVIAGNRFETPELDLVKQFNEFDIPFIIVHNKCDEEMLTPETRKMIALQINDIPLLDFSALYPQNIDEIVEALKKVIPETAYQKVTLFGELVQEKDLIILVTPIDNEAPEGRLILPQVTAIRDVLDHYAISVVLQESELEYFLQHSTIAPKMVVTDSQAFDKVSNIVPKEIPLTSFSILFARLKGNFEAFLKGTPCIDNLKDGDKVLIMESCTHHVNCDDIGRYKIPNWLTKYTDKRLEFEVVNSFQTAKDDIKTYAIVIQCGGCMFTRKQVLNKLKPAIEQGIPVSNYGMAIAYIHGIFPRATELFRTIAL